MRALSSAILLCLLALPAFASRDADLVAAGRAATAKRDFDQAAKLFEQAIAANPKNADAHYRLGEVYGVQAQQASLFKQASLAKKVKNEFEAAVALDPNHLDARAALIEFYTIAPGFLGGSEEKALVQAAEIKKRDALEGHRAYARIYVRQKKLDLARKELVDAVREQPNSAPAHHSLAMFLMTGDKNYAGSLHEFEMALKLDPNFMPARLRIGQHAVLSGGDYARGEAEVRKYLTYTPKDDEPPIAAAWYWLGMLQEKQGRKADAKASFANALKLMPDQKTFKEALQRVS
jgi:tetratricopeptide (TPR) repeat protein